MKVVAEEDREEAVGAVGVEIVLKMDKGRRLVDKNQGTAYKKERREQMVALKRDNQTGIPDLHSQKPVISCKRRNTSQETPILEENQEMAAIARQEEEADVDAVVAEVIEVAEAMMVQIPVITEINVKSWFTSRVSQINQISQISHQKIQNSISSLKKVIKYGERRFRQRKTCDMMKK